MAEERLDRLAAMFTEVDRPTLAAVLEAHNGDLQAAASFLLDAPPPPTQTTQAPAHQPQHPQAPPPASEQDLGPQPAMQEYRIQTTLSKGWLEKQSGGKTGLPKKSLGDKLRKWDVRFFVLTFDAIYYFKFEEDFLAGRPAKGRIMLDKNMFFLEVDQNGDHMLHFRSMARVFKARCEGPTQFVWWGDVMRAAYIVQLRTWSAGEVDEWVQLIGCNQTDLFSTRNVDGTKLLNCRAREDLHKLLGLTGAHAGAWRQDADRVYNAVSSWRTAGSKAKLDSMNDHLANVGARRKLRDYEAATQYVIAKCIETVHFEGVPGSADSVTAPGSKPGPAPDQIGQQPPGPAGRGAVDTSVSHAVEYLTCGWLEKQSGGHSDLGGSHKRKMTFGQAAMKWDIRFCALELDPASYDFRLNYYRNQEEWQARMPPKGSVGVGLAQVELLRSMQEPVDYRMTIRTRDRLFSFRASLKDLKLWIATIRTATLCSAATWSSQELATFVALSGVTEDCINAIIQSNMDGRKIIMCRTVLEMLPLFGLAPEDLQSSSPKYLLAKDVEKTFDLFDRYRMYASTGRLRDALAGLQSVDGLRDLSEAEFDQQTRFRFVLQMTDPTQGPSATEIVRQAAAAAAEPEPEQQAGAATDADADERDFSSSEEDWDDFKAPPTPDNPPDQIVPPGMTAGGLARRRASLAPQPTLPEVDHQLNRKALTVSDAPAMAEVAEEEGEEDYGHFMAAVEDDV